MTDPFVYNATAPDGSGATYSGPTSNLPAGYTVPAPAPANTMPADALGKTPSMYSTYAPPKTASAGLAETATAQKDAALKSISDEAATAKTLQNTQLGQAQSLFDRLGLSATSKVDAENAAGLPEQQQSINDLTAEMDSTSRSFDKQIQAVQQNNPTGELASGVTNDVNRLTQQKASALADLAIVLNAKTNNFTAAKKVVDDKADAETEDLKTQLSSLQFFYGENKDTLTKDQQTLLSDKIDAADKEYQDAKQARVDVGNVQLAAAKNGAPVSVVQAIGKSTDEESAITAAGAYLSSNSGTNVFSQTQKNNGASNAGLSIADFGGLTPDDQNYFINGYSGFSAAMKQVDAGTATQSDLKDAIDEAPITTAAKDILYKQAGISDTTQADTGGGFWSSVGSFVSNLFTS